FVGTDRRDAGDDRSQRLPRLVMSRTPEAVLDHGPDVLVLGKWIEPRPEGRPDREGLGLLPPPSGIDVEVARQSLPPDRSSPCRCPTRARVSDARHPAVKDPRRNGESNTAFQEVGVFWWISTLSRTNLSHPDAMVSRPGKTTHS